MKIYCDGSGWNGKVSRYAIVHKGNASVVSLEEELTNNDMEYRAVVEAVKLAKRGDTILSDSQLVVYQVLGTYRVRNMKFMTPIQYIRKKLFEAGAKIKWIPREDNIAGHALEGKLTPLDISGV
jgi:ribonuclease HI